MRRRPSCVVIDNEKLIAAIPRGYKPPMPDGPRATYGNAKRYELLTKAIKKVLDRLGNRRYVIGDRNGEPLGQDEIDPLHAWGPTFYPAIWREVDKAEWAIASKIDAIVAKEWAFFDQCENERRLLEAELNTLQQMKEQAVSAPRKARAKEPAIPTPTKARAKKPEAQIIKFPSMPKKGGK